MFSSGFHGDPAPIAILAVDDEDATELGLIDDLHAVWNGEESHPARRLTTRVRIVESAAGTPVLVERSCPLLKGNLVEREIRRQPAGSNRAPGHDIPESFDARHLTQIDTAVRPSRRRFCGSGRRSATAASPCAPGPRSSLIASGPFTSSARPGLRTDCRSLRFEWRARH